MKNMVTMKKMGKEKVMKVTQWISSIISVEEIKKKKYMRAFTIPCTIGFYDRDRDFCDNGARFYLISLTIYKKFDLSKSKCHDPTHQAMRSPTLTPR